MLVLQDSWNPEGSQKEGDCQSFTFVARVVRAHKKFSEEKKNMHHSKRIHISLLYTSKAEYIKVYWFIASGTCLADRRPQVFKAFLLVFACGWYKFTGAGGQDLQSNPLLLHAPSCFISQYVSCWFRNLLAGQSILIVFLKGHIPLDSS